MNRFGPKYLLSCAALLGLATGTQAALVAQYTFDDADIVNTKDQDDKVGTNNAVPTGAGGGTNIATGQAGQFGQAYAFTRDSAPTGGATLPLSDFENLMTLPAGLVPSGAAERTIAVWFNQAEDTAGQDKIWGYGTNLAGQAMDLSLEGGALRLRHFGGNITYGSGFDFPGADAGWHHVAVRVNSGASTFADVDVFLDGVQLPVSGTGGGGTGVAINTASSLFGIGTTSIDTGGAIQNGFTGSLDELRIYDTALSDQAIAALVPEPNTFALASVAGLFVLRRRRATNAC